MSFLDMFAVQEYLRYKNNTDTPPDNHPPQKLKPNTHNYTILPPEIIVICILSYHNLDISNKASENVPHIPGDLMSLFRRQPRKVFSKYECFGYFSRDRDRKIYYLFPSVTIHDKFGMYLSFKMIRSLELSRKVRLRDDMFEFLMLEGLKVGNVCDNGIIIDDRGDGKVGDKFFGSLYTTCLKKVVVENCELVRGDNWNKSIFRELRMLGLVGCGNVNNNFFNNYFGKLTRLVLNKMDNVDIINFNDANKFINLKCVKVCGCPKFTDNLFKYYLLPNLIVMIIADSDIITGGNWVDMNSLRFIQICDCYEFSDSFFTYHNLDNLKRLYLHNLLKLKCINWRPMKMLKTLTMGNCCNDNLLVETKGLKVLTFNKVRIQSEELWTQIDVAKLSFTSLQLSGKFFDRFNFEHCVELKLQIIDLSSHTFEKEIEFDVLFILKFNKVWFDKSFLEKCSFKDIRIMNLCDISIFELNDNNEKVICSDFRFNIESIDTLYYLDVTNNNNFLASNKLNNLKSLVLSQVYVSNKWNPLNPLNLERMIVHNCNVSDEMFVQNTFGNLKLLKICNIDIFGTKEWNPLPNLKTFSINNCVNVNDELFQNVKFDNLENLIIFCVAFSENFKLYKWLDIPKLRRLTLSNGISKCLDKDYKTRFRSSVKINDSCSLHGGRDLMFESPFF